MGVERLVPITKRGYQKLVKYWLKETNGRVHYLGTLNVGTVFNDSPSNGPFYIGWYHHKTDIGDVVRYTVFDATLFQHERHESVRIQQIGNTNRYYTYYRNKKGIYWMTLWRKSNVSKMMEFESRASFDSYEEIQEITLKIKEELI